MTHHPSWGTLVGYDAAGGTVYAAINQVKDIAGPNMSRGDIDVSDHDSALGYREFLPGLTDAGDVSFQLGFDPTDAVHTQGTAGLLYNFELDGCTMTSWEIDLNVCTGTAIWTFDGYVNSWSGTYAVEGELLADIGIKISGKPTLTITS